MSTQPTAVPARYISVQELHPGRWCIRNGEPFEIERIRVEQSGQTTRYHLTVNTADWKPNWEEFKHIYDGNALLVLAHVEYREVKLIGFTENESILSLECAAIEKGEQENVGSLIGTVGIYHDRDDYEDGEDHENSSLSHSILRCWNARNKEAVSHKIKSPKVERPVILELKIIYGEFGRKAIRVCGVK